MNFKAHQIEAEGWKMVVLLYFVLALLTASVFSYGAFFLKAYVLRQKINGIDKEIAAYGTQKQKEQESRVLDYKKKIDDFAAIFGERKVASNIFGFLEEKTLPSVWFFGFDFSQASSEARLLGEAENMEALSRQTRLFEENKDLVKSVNVVNAQTISGGKIRFVLSLSFEPKIFAEKRL